MKFAPEAWPFVLPFAALSLALLFIDRPIAAAVAALLALAILLFFRDPKRGFEGPESAILAPADGRVLAVDTIQDEEIGPGSYQRVITFLSVFDVHLQRVPTDGEVLTSQLTDGRYKAAFDLEAGEVNARHLTVIQRSNGERVGIRQVVGLVARRIVNDLEPGQQVTRGQRLGLIKFGSRVDLLVPEGYTIEVEPGQRLRNGESVVARAPDPEP
ncbi:MAG: phosphatidylserine decarboxylase [Acidobacteriota bacterium]